MWKALVISGGGYKAVSFLSSLQTIQLTYPNWFKPIQYLVGTSSGSMIAALLLIGYSLDELLYLLEHFPLRHIWKPSIYQLQKGGLNDSQFIEHFMKACFLQKGISPDLTFLQAQQQFHRSLVCSVFNLNLLQTEFLSPDSTPHLSICKAVRMSCCFPAVFTPVYHDGYMYIDGGVLDNFPIRYLLEKKEIPKEKILGIAYWLSKDILMKEKQPEENYQWNFYMERIWSFFQLPTASSFESLHSNDWIVFENFSRESTYQFQPEWIEIGKQKTELFLQNLFFRKKKHYLQSKYFAIWFQKINGKDKPLHDREVQQVHLEPSLPPLLTSEDVQPLHSQIPL